MGKLAVFLLTAGILLGGVMEACAIDWKIKGAWYLEFGVYDRLTLMRDAYRGSGKSQYGPGNKAPAVPVSGDSFNAAQRADFWLEAVASESLSGSMRFEVGPYMWGRGNLPGRLGNGALGQRSQGAALRTAYIDFFVPDTALKFRMGIQPLATPSFSFGANVLGNDMAAVAASYVFNDNISLTAFWARPYNDNYDGDADRQAAPLDNMDLFALLAPFSFDGFKFTFWGMVGAGGPNVFRSGYGARGASVASGIFPGHWQTVHPDKGPNGAYGASRQYGVMWWAALTGEITAADPFRFAWDAVYGSVTRPDAGHLNRSGWYVNALLEYRLDSGVPGIYGWLSSGDDGNPENGSGRMPTFDPWVPFNDLSSFGFHGATLPGASPNGIFGLGAFAGTWGVGARIRELSFMNDLKHTLRANIFGGSNDPGMAKYILGKKNIGARGGLVDDFNSAGGLYLTRRDYGLELNLDSIYKIYENLRLIVELGYIHLWLDQSCDAWGGGGEKYPGVRGVSVADAVKAAMYLHYTF